MKSIATSVAERLGLPHEFVLGVLGTPLERIVAAGQYFAANNGEEPEQDYPRHHRFAARIVHLMPNPAESYIDYLDDVEVAEVTTSEAEGNIRAHPTFQRYVGWFRQGHMPPYPSIFEMVRDGRRRLVSANRRSVLCAKEAGVKSIPAWIGPWNKETGLPLKYGDILAAADAMG